MVREYRAAIKLLSWGFLLSVVLILAAYFSVSCECLERIDLLFLVLGLGFVQAIIQLICFFHLGLEEKPQWQLLNFLFMLVILAVVVGGSMWIMYHLNYNMMLK